jgi:hypothetical protein
MTEPRRSAQSTRSLLTALVLLLVAAFALWVAGLLPPRDSQPALVPLAVLSLAAGAAVLATSGWLRRLIGALIVLSAAAPIGVLVWSGPPAAAAALCAAAGLLLLAAGSLVVARGHRMPRMGSRYSSSSRPREPTPWDELDAGRDPTR